MREDAAGWREAVVTANSVNEAWLALKDRATASMEEHVPKLPKQARRAWITAETMELVEHRRALASHGLMEDARAMGKMIKANARDDKHRWLRERMAEKFWDPIKEATRKPQPKVVTLKGKGHDGPTQSSAQVYAEHLGTEQWGKPKDEEGPNVATADAERRRPEEEWGTARIGTGDVDIETGSITAAEVAEAIREASRGKAPGLDGIPAEMWKALGGNIEALVALFNRCWNEEMFPDDWREAKVVGLFKKGKADDPANYRPISLLQTAYKLFARIMARRLEAGLSDNLRETQFGFRKGRSTSEPMFILRRLQDLVHAKRSHALHLVFLDWAKAFDKVDTECVPTVLKRFGVPERWSGS